MGETDRQIDIELILDAQLGDEDSVSRLAEHVREKVYTYIFRLTLDPHLADDLTQEAIVDMLGSLKALRLKNRETFWGWMYRTALGKVQHHFRGLKQLHIRHKTMLEYGTHIEETYDRQAGTAGTLIRRESARRVMEAVNALNMKYRNILTLRCLNGMPYNEIAAVMGGTELRSRLLYLRAKRRFEKELKRRGIKRSEVLAALATFAGLTIRSGSSTVHAAVSIGLTDIGPGMKVLSFLSSSYTQMVVILTVVILIYAPIDLSRFYDPFAALRPVRNIPQLWSRDIFSNPSGVMRTGDTPGTWRGTDISPQTRATESFDPNILTQAHRIRPTFSLILPRGHILELEFPDTIKDSPGADIVMFVHTRIRPPDVAVIDPAGRPLRATPTSILSGFAHEQAWVIGYDISPAVSGAGRRVRITGNSNAGAYGGFVINTIRARMAVSDANRH